MIARATLGALLLMMSVVGAAAAVRIYDDPGGRIGDYLTRYRALRSSGERVEIDGLCASACTMVLGLVPQNRICVTSRAVLEFHNAWDPGAFGEQTASAAGNRILWSIYPAKIRSWIVRHGGLQSRILHLDGRELAAMYPTCR